MRRPGFLGGLRAGGGGGRLVLLRKADRASITQAGGSVSHARALLAPPSGVGHTTPGRCATEEANLYLHAVSARCEVGQGGVGFERVGGYGCPRRAEQQLSQTSP